MVVTSTGCVCPVRRFNSSSLGRSFKIMPQEPVSERRPLTLGPDRRSAVLSVGPSHIPSLWHRTSLVHVRAYSTSLATPVSRPQLVCRRARTAVSRGIPCLHTSFRCMARNGARLAAPGRRLFAAPRSPGPHTHGPLPPHAWSTAPPRMIHGGRRRSDSSTVTPHSHRPGRRGGTDRATARGPPCRRAA